MANKLQQVVLIGAALGISDLISDLLPEPKPPKVFGDDDRRRIEMAEQKRQRRLERNKMRISPTS